MLSTHLRLAFRSQLDQVRFASAALRAMLVEAGCAPDRIMEIELCVVEAINNAIEHSYREQPDHEVQLAIDVSAERVCVAVSDRGAAMPGGTLEAARAALAASASAEPLAVGDLAEGGYGLGLILQVMDEVAYRSAHGENVLAMTLHVSP